MPIISAINPIFSAVVRIQIVLNPDHPQASEVQISLMSPPQFDLQLRIGRIDLFALPFLRPFILSTTEDVLRGLLIYPLSLRFSNGVLQLAARSQLEDSTPITHLRLYFPSKDREALPSGWFVLSSTLPTRFGALFGMCYILFKREAVSRRVPPIVDVQLCCRNARGNLIQDLLPHGYRWVDDGSTDNLRFGVTGSDLYLSLCYKVQTNPSERPITAVALSKMRLPARDYPDWRTIDRTVSLAHQVSLSGQSENSPVFFAFRRDQAHQPDADFNSRRPIADIRLVVGAC